MEGVGTRPGRGTSFTAVALLGAVFAATAILGAVGRSDSGDNPPEAFFALRGTGAEVVQVDSDTGEVVRSIVDLGEDDVMTNTDGLIDGIDLAADGGTLWFSRYLQEPGVVYRVRLPDGHPERVTEGHGASVSPDGRNLALIRRTDVVIRNLITGQERVFRGVLGELGGSATAWAVDGNRLALEVAGADVSGVDLLDPATGEQTSLQPVGLPAENYWVTSPVFRASDGLLGVLCCYSGEVVEGDPPAETKVALHDPMTGAEQSWFRLPVPAGDIDWDTTGSHLLISSGGRVLRYHDGRFLEIPRIRDVFAVAW